jgi:hypothetical protein
MRRPDAMKPKPVYRVLFQNQGNLYELYARKVGQGPLFAFVEVEGILFGNRGGVLVDPSEEKLKSEFAGVQRTHIPLQAVVRIDEVEKEGTNKIVSLPASHGNVATIPVPHNSPGGKPDRG